MTITRRDGEDRRGGTVSLRGVRPDDDAFLLEVYASTRAEEMALVGWDEAQQRAFVRMQFDAQRRSYQMQCPEADHSIIELDGKPVGRIIVGRTSEGIRLMDISLLPAHRQSGIGSRLIRQLQDEARAHGVPLRLHVETFNPARRLYERLGFSKGAARGIHLEMIWCAGAGDPLPSASLPARNG